MDNNYVLVEYISQLNSIIKDSFHSMQRVKPKCFNVSENYITFGATSGGIYIFKREPCNFLKIIPTKGGSADLIAISPDEKYLSIANSRGIIYIFENFHDANVEHQIFNEHEKFVVTCMKWNKNTLYIGDNSGKVSVATLSSTLAKTIFQVPSESVMKLDSSIVQIDAYNSYLLVSTKTRSYFCNTEKECYVQVGKKMRNGHFGACFCVTNIESNNTTQENLKIYCARPGMRLWEASLDAKVIMTYQFKESLTNNPIDTLVLRPEQNAILQERKCAENHEALKEVSFQKIFSLCEYFILTYHANVLYIFNLISNKLLCQVPFSSIVKEVAFQNELIYVWTSNLEVSVFSLMKLEKLILKSIYNEQYMMCAEICVKYCDKLMDLLRETKELSLVAVIKKKIKNEMLLNTLSPIFEEINKLNKKVVEKNQNNIISFDQEKTELVVEEKGDNEFKKLFKQYTLNKTHKMLELPEVKKIFLNLTIAELFTIFIDFMDYADKEVEKDVSRWCQEQILKQIENNNVKMIQLETDCLEFLTNALIFVNQSINYSCSCGFPLPKCHRFAPKYGQIGLDLIKTKQNVKHILKGVPYLMKHRIKTDIYGINIPLLIQFSDELVFKEYSKELEYDKWYDVLGYFNKLQGGICLNCDKHINIEGCLSWTEMGKIVLHSVGARNTIRILKRFENQIPKGALDAKFYQTCILAHLFKGENGDMRSNADKALAFVHQFEARDCNSLQDNIEKYLNKKYNGQESMQGVMYDKKYCPTCHLQLKNEILECVKAKVCQHVFHKFCLQQNNGKCTVCPVT